MRRVLVRWLNVPFILPSFYGDFENDFDVLAIEDEVIGAVNEKVRTIAPFATVHVNGMVFCDEDEVDAVYDFDFGTAIDECIIEAVLSAHEISDREN